MYLDTIPPQKSIFEFALRARKITILGALATQFHEMSGLGGTICENFWRGFAEICGDYSWCKVLLYWRDARRGFSGG
jgi:hypothetical protein